MPAIVRSLAAAVLLELAQRRMPPEARAWFDRMSAAAGAALDPRAVAAAYAEAPRRLGRLPLELGPDDRRALCAAGVTWPLDAWRLDDAARAGWLVSVASRAPQATVDPLVEDIYRRGDGGAQASTLRSLALLPDAERFLTVALAGCRAMTRPVLAAITCDNPYPAVHFHEVHFTDMVLRALRAELPLSRVVGLERRVTPELIAGAGRFAAERRASGRAAPDDLFRVTGELASAA